jgi:hypothetical protein
MTIAHVRFSRAMRFVIDGYNLLFAIGRLGPRSGKAALEGARSWLTQQLRKGHPPGSDVTVVFDGAGRDEDHGGVRVEFSRGESADDVIEARIRGESAPRLLTVVSNDRRLRQTGRRRGCLVLDCLDYFEQLGAAPPEAGATPLAEAKPETASAEEAERWLREFGDAGDDPLLRDPF